MTVSNCLLTRSCRNSHARHDAQEAWKADVLERRIVLEDIDTASYDLYAHQNEDIVRLSPEQLKQRMAEKEKGLQLDRRPSLQLGGKQHYLASFISMPLISSANALKSPSRVLSLR